MLEPHVPNTIPNRIEEPPPPVTIDDTVEYEISQILDRKLPSVENDWLPATELEHAKELIADFHKAYPDKPGPHLS
ncbi:hypothetical protein M422DRAFT_267101 [Sphaerobolus stellatus SS14]|uniref:Uncharacterized protein n=1 Tax=Sphaerobolus stellatus (strain SS14) TaxID=990650 RepID=A0A0C9U9S7_SPHS4|nr:hypothetical protein M422DRAFT_267101 [Sphaerobolus stellatus SS14]